MSFQLNRNCEIARTNQATMPMLQSMSEDRSSSFILRYDNAPSWRFFGEENPISANKINFHSVAFLYRHSHD